MSHTGGPYSPLKVFHHQDKLAEIRAGLQPIPLQVQLILSDLCNHDCGFCLMENTEVATVDGAKPIQDVRFGDRVLDLSGGISSVTRTSERRVGVVVEIQAGGSSVRCSEEHPVLTPEGFVQASKIRPGTSVVCVRMRRASENARRSEPENLAFCREGWEWSLEESKVDSVRRIHGDFPVFNFSCSPGETYIADGFAVHNCAYRMSGYTSNENFVGESELAAFGTNNPKRMIPHAKASEILADCAEMGVKAIQFSVWGNELIPVVSPDNRLLSVPIGEFVDQFFNGDCSAHESADVSDNGWMTYAISDNGQVILDQLTHVYRHPATEDLYEVVLKGGMSAFVTASHSLNVVREGKIQKVPVSQITTDDKVAVGMWRSVGQFFPPKIQVPESDQPWAANEVPDEVEVNDCLMRLLGYFAAEGSYCSRSLLFVFGKNRRDRKYINDVVSCCKSLFGLTARIHHRDSSVIVRIDSVRIQSLFKQCGLDGTQSNRRCPWFIWSAPSELKMEFLSALFAGDGNFRETVDSRGYRRNSLHLKTCNRQLASEVYAVLKQCDVRATISSGTNSRRTIQGRQLPETTYYSVNVYDKSSLMAAGKIVSAVGGSPLYLDSVHSHPKPHVVHDAFGQECFAVPVKSIRVASELGRPIVYDVTVRSTHRFMTVQGVGCANTGGGEPTVHPQHLDLFQQTLDHGMDLALVTNGCVMRDRSYDILAQAKWVRVSVDAGTEKTYCETRRVSPVMWQRVWENIRKLAEERDWRKCEGLDCDLILGVGFVVTAENWHEVIEATKLAREHRADNIRISAVFQPDDEKYFAGFYAEAAELCRQATELATPEFRVFNNFGERVGDLKQHSPDYEYCGYQHLNTYIGGDLNVYRCCNLAYSARGKIGSLKDQRFRDFWLSQEKIEAMEGFDARGCDRCMFNAKNRTILYAIETNPEHVNYI